MVEQLREKEAQATAARPPVVATGESARSARFSSHALSIAVIVLLVVGMFWRVLFLGETLIDVATLNNQLPWGYYAGQSDYPYNRRDPTDMYLTREYFVVAAYGDKELPLWNPYTMAGHPIYADGVTRSFSPFLLLYTFLDVPLGYSVARITELLLAAVFMYIFLVSMRVSPRASLMGSLVFIFSGHSLLHLTHLGWWGGLMWLPLIFLYIDRAMQRRSYRAAVVAGLFLGAQFFCSFLPAQVYYPGAILLYYLFFAFRRGGLRRAVAMMAITIGVGFAIGATQWMPMLDLLQYSNRRIVGAELGYIYLPPWYVLTLVFPNFFGSAYDTATLTLFTALSVSHDHILYLSIAALAALGFLAYALGKAERKDSPFGDDLTRGRVLFFLLLAAVALALMMAAPLYVPITKYIPLLRVIRVAVRAWVLLIFAAAVLVGFGADALFKASSESLRAFALYAKRFLFAAAAFVALATAGALALRATGFAVDAGGSGRLAFMRKAAAVLSEQLLPPDAGLLFPLLLLGAVAALLHLVAAARISRSAFAAALVALVAADLFWNAAQFTKSFDRSRVFPETKMTSLIQSLPEGRLLIVPSGILTNRRVEGEPNQEKIIAPPNTMLPYRIPTVTGKNQQFPAWYQEFVSLIEPQKYPSHVVFDRSRSRLFDLLNVRYVLTHASRPALEGYDLIASHEGVSLYENKRALPRAFFAASVIKARTHKDALNILAGESFDPATTAVVEEVEAAGAEESGSGVSQGSTIASVGRASVIDAHRNRLAIETDNAGDGLLVVSDNYYPGWRATIDGKPARVLRANYTMRAVEVPAGRHVVSFEFAPEVLRRSAYASLVALALALAALAWLTLKERRRRAVEE